MYYNKNLKSLLFDFRSDVNFTALVIISLLKSFYCNNKRNSFRDYRKIGLVIEFIFRDVETSIFIKFLNKEILSAQELQILSMSYFNSKLEEKTINTALVILERKGIIRFYKTSKSSNVYFSSYDKIKQYPVLNTIQDNIDQLLGVKDKLYGFEYNGITKYISDLRGESTFA